jgi:subtilisin
MTGKQDLTRRRVLQTVGAGVGTAGMASAVSGQRDGRPMLVGLDSQLGDMASVKSQALSVKREIDLGDVRQLVAGRFDRETIKSLRNRSDVAYVVPNDPVRLVDPIESDLGATDQETPWGIEKTGAPAAHDQGVTGDGVTIAVIDTGIDSDHETLSDQIVGGKAYVDCGQGDIDNECKEAWDDDHNHGTHVSGSAAAADNGLGVVGMAPDADLLAVKALSGGGFGSPDGIVGGIEWATDNGADVINMSLGGPIPQPGMEDAVNYAANNGAIVVAAAGNSGSEEDGPCEDCVGYPAALENAVAISATTEQDEIAFFSSTGPQVELGAPGYQVNSSLADGDNSYGVYSGTSMASPHAAGATAALVGEGASPEAAVGALKSAADDIGAPDDYQGAGRLNLIDAVNEIPEPGPVEVSTGSAGGVSEDSATLSGTVDNLENASSADVFFEYGVAGSGLSETVDAGTAGEGEEFSAEVTGLESGTSYEFVAVASANNETGEGFVSSFETDDPFEFCFITTATADDTATLDSLRRFRDDSMKATPVGKGLVGLYYRISPPIARTLDRHPDSPEAGLTRKLIDTSASLSDSQDDTDSRVKSATLGVMLTMLYIVGLVVGAAGHASLRARETLS